MQKKIIALAVAALASGAALAQTNVTVYGVMDVQQAMVKSSGATGNNALNQGSVGRLDAHGSYIGFKGTEDLGNGLKAIFQFESSISPDTNSTGNAFGGREALVGLAGGFGTVAAGTLTHPLRTMGIKVELLPGAVGFGTANSVTGTMLGIKTGADDRAQNAVAYISPSFSGFTATVAYVNGERKTDSTSAASVTTPDISAAGRTMTTGTQGAINAKQWQIAGQYDNGPLFVAAGYHKTKGFSLSAPRGALQGDAISGFQEDGMDARVIRLATAYTLPTKTKLTALYDNTKLDLGTVGATVVGATSAKRTAWSVGVAHPFGKNTVGLQYARSGNVKLEGPAVGAQDNDKVSMYTLVYGYELSKRTQLHARYSKLTNGADGNTNFYNMPVSNGPTTGAGSDYTGMSVGVRHSF